MPQGALGLMRHVDLAFLEALDQILRRQVDDLDLVGAVEDAVRHGLADPDAGDLRDDVVEALDMLDVERRIDVDARRQQLLDIEIALGMAAARRVAVRELVDEHQLGLAREERVEIHLLERVALVVDAAARHDLEPGEQRQGFAPSMRLDHPDDDVDIVAPAASAPFAASRRFCRRPGRRRGRS